MTCKLKPDEKLIWWQAWLAKNDALTKKVLLRRGGELIDVDDLLRRDRKDVETRGDWIIDETSST